MGRALTIHFGHKSRKVDKMKRTFFNRQLASKNQDFDQNLQNIKTISRNQDQWAPRYHTKCIKRVGGFPNKIIVLVATLSIDVALT